MEKYFKIRDKIEKEIEKNLAELSCLSEDIADHPEVSGEEYETSKKLVELLRSKGFDTEYPYAGLDTAFKAVYGKNDHKYKVAVLTEFDALPEIGHACGYRTIWTAIFMSSELRLKKPTAPSASCARREYSKIMTWP